MNTWMRRRIERSRARCEKSAANNKSDGTREAKTGSNGQARPPQNVAR
jgi:hypothetical protein